MEKNFSVVGKIKGITTSIKDMKICGKEIFVISLDGYLRVFNLNSKEMIF